MADDINDVASVEDVPKKKKSKLILLLPVLALALGGGGGFYQYQKASAPAVEEGTEKVEPIVYGQFAPLAGIIVNPAGSGGRRYLMVDLALEAADEKTLEEVKSREVVIRDAVVRILSEQTVEKLASVAARPALKDTLRFSVNEILDQDIDRLYFTQYVLQ